MKLSKSAILFFLMLLCSSIIYGQSIKFSDFQKISQKSRTGFKKFAKAKGFIEQQGMTNLTKGRAGNSNYEQIGYLDYQEDGKSITYLCSNDKFVEKILEQMLLDKNWSKVPTSEGSIQYCNVQQQACFSITNMGLAYTLTYACCKQK